MTRPPASLMAVSAACSRSPGRSAIATGRPRPAKRRAAANPMPLAPPVMTAAPPSVRGSSFRFVSFMPRRLAQRHPDRTVQVDRLGGVVASDFLEIHDYLRG